MDSYRNVAAIVICLAVLQAALGALAIVGPLTLLEAGKGGGAIGLIASAYGAGFLIGARIVARELALIGHIRAISAFAALAALAAAALSLSTSTLWWMGAEFILGLCAASLMAAGEGWIADASPDDRRGSILGFYLVLSKLGYMAGPFLAAAAPDGAVYGFLLIVCLLVACLIPVAATRRAEPAPPSAPPMGLLALWKTAPAAILTAFAAGVSNAAVLQLYSLFTENVTTSEAGAQAAAFAAAFNAALVAGGVISQWPAGLISDHFDRRLVIAVMAGASAIGALIIAAFGDILPGIGLLAAAALWGAGSLSFYGVGVAHAADRARPGEAASMMSGILMVWAIGSMIGPAAAGFVMSAIGASGLFYFVAAALTMLTFAMMIRRAGRPGTLETEKEDFAPSAATSVSMAELNPMGEEESVDRPA